MADLVTIGQLSALVEDQYRLMAFLEDHAEQVPAFDAVFDDRNETTVEIGGDPWSITVGRTRLSCTHRASGRTVLLERDHPSPFDFAPRGLLHFVRSLDGDSRLTDIVVDNWVTRFVIAGRLTRSRHREGYYTFA
jgi:hypothetical protein